MGSEMQAIKELGHEERERFILDVMRHTVVHHTFWFREVERQDTSLL